MFDRPGISSRQSHNKSHDEPLLSLRGCSSSQSSHAFFKECLTTAFIIVYFMAASTAATFSVKALLTSHQFDFPLTLAVCQSLVTVIALLPSLPSCGRHVVDLLPLSFAFAVNLVSGLVGTERLSVPMYIALRRIGVLFVIVLEQTVYHQKQTLVVVAAVVIMCAGSVVAAYNDLDFDATGYAFVTLHNLFSAANIVLVRRNATAHSLSMAHLLFYNAALALPFLGVALAQTDEVNRLVQLAPRNNAFYLNLCIACGVGIVVSHSSYLLTRTTSPLTCSVAGSAKSILVSIAGAFLFPFKYDVWNVAGLGISMAGATMYTVFAGKAA